MPAPVPGRAGVFALPLCLAGVAAVFWATGTSFSREAAVGVILVVGLAVHQATLLVDPALEKRRTVSGTNRLTIEDVLSADNLFSAIALATAGGTIAGTLGALWIVPAYLVGRRAKKAPN